MRSQADKTKFLEDWCETIADEGCFNEETCRLAMYAVMEFMGYTLLPIDPHEEEEDPSLKWVKEDSGHGEILADVLEYFDSLSSEDRIRIINTIRKECTRSSFIQIADSILREYDEFER